MQSMNDLMLHFLQDIYYAERLGVKSYPKLMKAVQNEDLKQALQEHKDQSAEQVERLKQVFEAFGKRAKAKVCAAMDGLTEECDEAIEEGEPGPVLDAALIACAQAIEHYEIARYGAMAAWAKQLGQDEAAELLQTTLEEEKAFDQRLNEIAEASVNQEAQDSGEEDDHEDEEGEDEAPEGEESEEKAKPAPKPKAKPAPKKK